MSRFRTLIPAGFVADARKEQNVKHAIARRPAGSQLEHEVEVTTIWSYDEAIWTRGALNGPNIWVAERHLLAIFDNTELVLRMYG